jgi:hypothetical protein
MRKIVQTLQDYAVFVFAALPVLVAATVAGAAGNLPLV